MNYPTCDRCGRQILPGKSLNGNLVPADEVARQRKDTFGVVLCDGCASDEVTKMAQSGVPGNQVLAMILKAGAKAAERKGEYIPAGVKSLIGALEESAAPYKLEPKSEWTPMDGRVTYSQAGQPPFTVAKPAPAAGTVNDYLKARMAAAAQAQEEAILGGFTPRTGPSKVIAADYGLKVPMTVEVGPKVPDIKFKRFSAQEYASKLYGEPLAKAMFLGSIIVAEVPTDLTRNEVGLSIAECAEIFGLDVVEIKSSSPNQIAFRIVEQTLDLDEDEDEDDDY